MIALAAIVALAVVGVSIWIVADRAREAWRKSSARSELIAAGNTSFDAHEVTDAQFDLCVREDRCRPPGDTGDEFPWRVRRSLGRRATGGRVLQLDRQTPTRA